MTGVGVVMALVATLAAGPARAGDAAAPAAANPRYAAWARCKPGASATLATQPEPGGAAAVQMKTTYTLSAVTPEAVTVSAITVVSLSGQDNPGSTAKETIPANDAGPLTPAGTADVVAMGRTFPCKVYTFAAPPLSAGVAGFNAGTLYLNDDVPGGVVKLVVNKRRGKTVTYLLADVAAK